MGASWGVLGTLWGSAGTPKSDRERGRETERERGRDVGEDKGTFSVLSTKAGTGNLVDGGARGE